MMLKHNKKKLTKPYIYNRYKTTRPTKRPFKKKTKRL